MKEYFLKPQVLQDRAIENMQDHLQNWISKLLDGKNKLTSIELVYLPYSIFPYQLQSRSIKESIQGFIGIETYDKHSVILPVDQETFELTPNISILPIGEEIAEKLAYDAIYNEAFIKEKRRSSIQLDMGKPFLLYAPYWVGYLKGKETDILVVDGLSGNIEVKLKDSILKAFLAEARLLKN